MGTDRVELLDRRTAELIISGTEADLIALVESRTRPMAGTPVWRDYWDASRESFREFPLAVPVEERLRVILSNGMRLTAIRIQLIRDLCSSAPVDVDYWGCIAEVFSGGKPPGCITWEDFIAPAFPEGPPEAGIHRDENGAILWTETSGRYLLTAANSSAMIASLRNNLRGLKVMRESDVVKFERWHRFRTRHPEFSIVYQIDF
jgi:hypothetical protein